MTGRATSNRVTLDNRRRCIIVAALRQHADTLRFTVATDRHHRREMDADAAIAEMLAGSFQSEAEREAGRS